MSQCISISLLQNIPSSKLKAKGKKHFEFISIVLNPDHNTVCDRLVTITSGRHTTNRSSVENGIIVISRLLKTRISVYSSASKKRL